MLKRIPLIQKQGSLPLNRNPWLVVLGGFEPPLREPKTLVLPLHHRTVFEIAIWMYFLRLSPFSTFRPTIYGAKVSISFRKRHKNTPKISQKNSLRDVFATKRTNHNTIFPISNPTYCFQTLHSPPPNTASLFQASHSHFPNPTSPLSNITSPPSEPDLLLSNITSPPSLCSLRHRPTQSRYPLPFNAEAAPTNRESLPFFRTSLPLSHQSTRFSRRNLAVWETFSIFANDRTPQCLLRQALLLHVKPVTNP